MPIYTKDFEAYENECKRRFWTIIVAMTCFGGILGFLLALSR